MLVNMLAGGGEFSSVVNEDDEGGFKVKKKLTRNVGESRE